MRVIQSDVQYSSVTGAVCVGSGGSLNPFVAVAKKEQN